MKKIISFALIAILLFSIIPLNCFATDENYYTLNVEYSDNKSNVESLNIAVIDDNVYVDIFQLGERLGYDVWLTKSEDGVVVFNNENKDIPRLLAIFYFGTTAVEYLVLNSLMDYEAPFNSTHNKNGTWVPLKYAIYALNSSMLIIDDVVMISMPKNTLLQTMLSAAGKMEEIQFDYYSDMNFSDGTIAWKTASSRIVNLFSGILKFEGESWLLMFQQFWGDTSAYDNKFGDELATLFCTNSDKELNALNDEIGLLIDIFSTDGKLATALTEIKTDLDSDVDDLYKQCNDLFKKIDESNSDVSKYNATYKKLENAFNKQSNFYDTGQVALDVQGGLDTVTKKLSVIGDILEVTGYISEFSQKDKYSTNALLSYLNEFGNNTILPETLTNTIKSNAELLNSNFAAYSVAKYIENNYSDWIQAGLKIGQQMGAQANLIMLAWNIATATVPFIKNGLESADNFELSTYAYALQQDSFINYVDFRGNIFGKEELINSENCYKLSQYFYTYLKSAYITRDAAIGSFAEFEEKSDAQDVLEEWAKPNDTIAEYLADIKMVSQDNKDGSLGFLPDLSKWLVSNYNDNDLLKVLGLASSNSDVVSKGDGLSKTALEEQIKQNTDKPILQFYYDDYDSDGNFEAFAVVGDADTSMGDNWYSNAEVWFVSEQKTELLKTDIYGYPNGILKGEKYSFLSLEKSAGGSGSTSYVFGVKDGIPQEMNVSEKYGDFSVDENYIFKGYVNDFSAGSHQWVYKEFLFDSQPFEFIENTPENAEYIKNRDTISTSDERDIVLVLDISGSMDGAPLDETKKASQKFINTILKQDASIGIVAYDSQASIVSNFNMNENYLTDKVAELDTGGGTNIESGLLNAQEMLKLSSAKKKIIVLMSDGEPNDGKVGDDLIEYAQSIKDEGTYIYTLGFFEDLGSSKSSAQVLMEDIASEGCHYEVANADDLVFFFGDIADQLNGQKYIYIRIACPTDVVVEYGGETLCSSDKKFNDRTSFGAMTLEDIEDSDEKIKTLRLKDGVNYDIKIEGTGRGKMDYTIGYMDDSGEYTDFRKFKNIPITKKTVIDTTTKHSNNIVLNVDEDGDGHYDSKYKAGENGVGELVDYTYIYYVVIGVLSGIAVLTVAIIITKKIKKRKVN